MKRKHLHVSATDLASSIAFHAALFSAPPVVLGTPIATPVCG